MTEAYNKIEAIFGIVKSLIITTNEFSIEESKG